MIAHRNGAPPDPHPADPGGGCGACAHPWDAHDRIGRRFCSATIAAKLERPCVCRPT